MGITITKSVGTWHEFAIDPVIAAPSGEISPIDLPDLVDVPLSPDLALDSFVFDPVVPARDTGVVQGPVSVIDIGLSVSVSGSGFSSIGGSLSASLVDGQASVDVEVDVVPPQSFDLSVDIFGI